jgi:hypothetical protein
MTAVTSLAGALDHIRGPPTTVTTYGPERDESLHAFLGRFDVTLRHEALPIPADASYLTVRQAGEYRGSVPASAFADVVDPPRDAPWTSGVRESGYGDFGELLAGARFTSLQRSHLLATSREVEDRAFRVGRGTLYAGFQSLSAYRAQLGVYERLVAETDLRAHVYGHPDWTPPAVDGVTVHTGAMGTETSADGTPADGTPADGTDPRDGRGPAADELGTFWFVAFDGGGDGMACALVAEEVSAGVYHGAWTYEPRPVRKLAAYLDATDGAEDADHPSAGHESGAVDEASGVDERPGSREQNG